MLWLSASVPFPSSFTTTCSFPQYQYPYLSSCVDVDLVIDVSLHLLAGVERVIQFVAEVCEHTDKLRWERVRREITWHTSRQLGKVTVAETTGLAATSVALPVLSDAVRNFSHQCKCAGFYRGKCFGGGRDGKEEVYPRWGSGAAPRKRLARHYPSTSIHHCLPQGKNSLILNCNWGRFWQRNLSGSSSSPLQVD